MIFWKKSVIEDIWQDIFNCSRWFAKV